MSIEDGALYHWFDPDTGTGDTEAMLDAAQGLWAAVAEVFPEAWDVSPRRSRLVHGVGIVALGCLMDEIIFRLRDDVIPSQAEFSEEIERIADACAWTGGEWSFGPGGKQGGMSCRTRRGRSRR